MFLAKASVEYTHVYPNYGKGKKQKKGAHRRGEGASVNYTRSSSFC